MSQTSPYAFDLIQPRIIILNDRGRAYTLHCRRLKDADWLAYFDAIVIVSEQDGKSVIKTIDFASPRIPLAESVLVGAEGYKVDGGTNLTDLTDWQRKIPLSHRQRLGDALSDVRASQPHPEAEFTIYPEGEVVYLDATFGAIKHVDEEGATRTTMVQLNGLKHTLQTPTEKQHKRFANENSRSIVIGGSRTGKTIYRASYPLLAALYDELVISVDGYSIDGQPLTTDREAIVKHMDMLHKVMAAQQLFQPQDTTSLATNEEDGE